MIVAWIVSLIFTQKGVVVGMHISPQISKDLILSLDSEELLLHSVAHFQSALGQKLCLSP